MATDLPLCGMDMMCSGKVPVASGLSSSSSIVVAVAKAVVALNSLNIPMRDFIELCGEGEWFVGSRGGAGDHAAITCSRAGCVTRLDFKPFALGGSVSFSPRHAVVVANSLQQSKKSEGSRDVFNAKIAAYEIAFMLIRQAYPHCDFRELRDIARVRPYAEIYRILKSIPETITRDEARERLPESGAKLADIFATHADPGSYDLRGVALFGISECARSAMCPALLAAGDYTRFGELMKRSHDGDRVAGERYTDAILDTLAERNEDVSLVCGAYGCSTPQIDAMCDLLNSLPGVLGSQLAGAGLGGCVIALVEKAHLSEVMETLNRDYYDANGLPHAAFACEPAAGSSVMF